MAYTTPVSDADLVAASAGLLIGWASATKCKGLTTSEYEGDLKFRSSVRVITIDAGDVQDYDPAVGLTYAAPTDTFVDVTLDKANAATVMIDDTMARVSPGYLAKSAQAKGVKMAAKVDLNIATVMAAEAGVVGADLGITATPVSLAAANAAYEYLVALNVKFGDRGDIRKVLVPTAFHAKLTLDPRFVGTGNTEVAQSGVVGHAAGWEIIVSDVLPVASGKHTVIAVVESGAVASATGLEKTETIRLQDTFADAIRMLVVHGAKVVIPAAVAKGIVTF